MDTCPRDICRTKWDEDHSDEEGSIGLLNSGTGCSTMSAESLECSRTASDLSNYSVHSRVTLNRLKLKQQHDGYLGDEEAQELEMMKDKFSKLLLGEEMSGSGKGVSTALAISNAMTNLYAVFGQFRRLEPIPHEKKLMWKRETDCLLSICEFIVDDASASRNLPDGSIKVTLKKPRSDICMNLPALRKLDSMLLEILESFKNTEFWYTEKGESQSSESIGSFNQRNEEKWWLPVPCVPPSGLSDKTRKMLVHTRESSNQMYRAARAINTSILSEIEVPETYITTLPKCGRAGVGDAVYCYMSTADQFSPEYFLDCLQIKSEHDALDVANRMEASMCIWKRKAVLQNSKSSWMGADDKNEILASRAESIMLCLKQRYPQMVQTTLDTCKIQYNKDVGQAILESYSRVLESLAFNVAARIEDVLHVDESERSGTQ